MKRLLVALLVVLSAGACLAQNNAAPQRAPAFRRGAAQFRLMRLDMLKQRLNLTPEQVQQIRQINQKQRLENFDRSTAAQAERQALLAALFAETPNQAEIHKHAAAIQQSHAAQLNQFVSNAEAINKVLTAEQRAEFQKMIATQVQRQTDARARMRERLLEAPASAAGK